MITPLTRILMFKRAHLLTSLMVQPPVSTWSFLAQNTVLQVTKSIFIYLLPGQKGVAMVLFPSPSTMVTNCKTGFACKIFAITFFTDDIPKHGTQYFILDNKSFKLIKAAENIV